MMTQLQTSLKDRWFKAVIWITLASMIIVFSPAIFKNASHEQTALSVNNEAISIQEYQRRVHQETERIYLFRQQLGDRADQLLAAMGIASPETLALHSLINEALVYGVAQKIPVTLSHTYIIQQLADAQVVVNDLRDVIPMYVLNAQGSINMNALQNYLKRYHISMKEFEDALERALERKGAMDILDSTLYISQAEIRRMAQLLYSPRDMTIVTLDQHDYLKKAQKQPVTQQELKVLFEEQNKQSKRYWIPEQRSAIAWEVGPEHYSSFITTDDIQAYYQAHKQQFIEQPLQVQLRRIVVNIDADGDAQTLQRAQEKIQALKERVMAKPEQFAAIAKESSEDRASAAQGGLMPFFKKGDKEKSIETAAFRLQKDGDISDIIATSQGLELLQRVARKQVTYQSLEQATPAIKETLASNYLSTHFPQEASKILEEEKAKPASLAATMQERKVRKREIKHAVKDNSVQQQKLFKLKSGESVAYTDNGKGIIMTATDITKSYEPSFEVASDRVKHDYYAAKAQELLEQDRNLLKTADTRPLAQRAKAVGAQIETLTALESRDNEKIKQLEERGLPVNALLTLDHDGAMLNGIYDNGNAYVIMLNHLTPLSEEEINSKKQEVWTVLANEKKELLHRGFIASLYRNATIKTTELLTRITEN